MEASYGLRGAFHRVARADVMVCVSPALFGSAAISLAYKIKNRGVPSALWIQDLYARGVAETDGTPRAAALMGRLERRVVRGFDQIVVAHSRFSDVVRDEYDVDSERIATIRNWTHVAMAQIHRDTARRELGWAVEERICLHAGNMGSKQGLENVVNAAMYAAAIHPHLRFVFVGGGHQEQHLRRMAQGLRNVEFIGPLDNTRFIAALQASDVLLVNESPGVREMSVPSKLSSYFASGRPVVAAVDSSSVTALEVRSSGGGKVVQSGQPELLANALSELAHDESLMRRLGLAGRNYAAAAYSQEAALDKFERLLDALVERRQPRAHD